MAGNPYSTASKPVSNNILSGGLNSTSGPLNVQENESSELQNIDFNKFGSILKRNGYAVLGTAGTAQIDGLHWFEFNNGGTLTRQAVVVSGGKFLKMDNLDGTWDDITGGVTITNGHHCDFENFLNTVFVTNGTDAPFQYSGIGGQVSGVSLSTAGTNYLALDLLRLDGGNYNSDVYVSSVSSGVITAITLNGPGNGYATGKVSTTELTSLSTGTGAYITITTVTTNAVPMALPIGVTTAKFVKQFNNYLFIGNVAMSS
jgi:hypothetical protein